MSVSAVSSSPAPAAAPQIKATTAVVARAADGDYKARSAATSQTKDADGDYKPRAAAGSAAQSTSAVQSALSILKVGG